MDREARPVACRDGVGLTIVGVTGAGGFIGRHTVAGLVAAGHEVRKIQRHEAGGARVVVHLAYSSDHAANIGIARDLVRTFIDANAERMIYCSTAVVAGRTGETVIGESTPCRPRTAYETTKYAIEGIMRDALGERVTIVRPTIVIGSGGRQLRKLLRALASGNSAWNALRSFLFGRRAMNLVPVEDVVCVVEKLVRGDVPPSGTLLISSDEDPRNEFQTVERLILEALGKPAAGSPIVAPPALLSLMGGLLGRSIAPRRRYITQFPAWRASTRVLDLSEAVQRFARTGGD